VTLNTLWHYWAKVLPTDYFSVS